MRVIALIEDAHVVRRILEHLGLWAPEPCERSPPIGHEAWPTYVTRSPTSPERTGAKALDPLRAARTAFAITPADSRCNRGPRPPAAAIRAGGRAPIVFRVPRSAQTGDTKRGVRD